LKLSWWNERQQSKLIIHKKNSKRVKKYKEGTKHEESRNLE